MLSKSKGQILRVSAIMHVLFHIDTPLEIPSIISDVAIKAADNFVDMCIQHAAFIAGRGEVQEAIDCVQQCKCVGMLCFNISSFESGYVHCTHSTGSQDYSHMYNIIFMTL